MTGTGFSRFLLLLCWTLNAVWSKEPPDYQEKDAASLAVKTAEELEQLPSLNRSFWVRTPRTKKPPVIDGTLDLDKGEWSDAACINGMINILPTVLLPLSCRTYVTWDEANIYVGVRTAIPDRGRLTRKMRVADGAFFEDDALELCLDPLGRDQDGPVFYHAIINSLGCVYDEKIAGAIVWWSTAGGGQSKGSYPAWNGGWTVKSDYQPGLDHWDLEAAIPVASMGIQDKNRSGQFWRFLAARVWKNLLDADSGEKLPNVYSSLGTAFGFNERKACGGLVLDDAAPVVQLLDLGPLAAEKLGLSARLQNTTAAPLACVVQVMAFSGEPPGAETTDWLARTNAVQTDRKAYQLKPGEETRYELAPRALPPLPAEKDPKTGLLKKTNFHEMVFAVTSPDGKIVYHREQRRFARGHLKHRAPPYAWPVKVEYNPLRNTLGIWADVLDHPNQDKVRAMRVEVYDIRDIDYKGKALANVRTDQLNRDTFEFNAVQPMPFLSRTGEYPVKATLLGENDAVLDTVVGLKIARRDYHWQTVIDPAAFTPRDGAGALVYKGKMWLIGGWNNDDKKYYPFACVNDVWSSKDGAAWTLEKPNTFLSKPFDSTRDWEGRHTAGYVAFNDRMWIVGGDMNQGHYHTDVWNSTDGKEWKCVTTNVPWGPRALHHTVVFKDRIWVMGGQTVPQFAPEEERFFNDVWSSRDGKEWTRELAHAPWEARGMIGGNVIFQDRLWVLGGGTYDTPRSKERRYYNDVWSTDDGINWKRHLAQAPWRPRSYHEVAVFDDKMWVLGGCAPDNSHDVWYSSDGVDWHELPDTPWPVRHASSVFVHDGSLWVVAGNNMHSDVWRLHRVPQGEGHGP